MSNSNSINPENNEHVADMSLNRGPKDGIFPSTPMEVEDIGQVSAQQFQQSTTTSLEEEPQSSGFPPLVSTTGQIEPTTSRNSSSSDSNPTVPATTRSSSQPDNSTNSVWNGSNPTIVKKSGIKAKFLVSVPEPSQIQKINDLYDHYDKESPNFDELSSMIIHTKKLPTKIYKLLITIKKKLINFTMHDLLCSFIEDQIDATVLKYQKEKKILQLKRENAQQLAIMVASENARDNLANCSIYLKGFEFKISPFNPFQNFFFVDIIGVSIDFDFEFLLKNLILLGSKPINIDFRDKDETTGTTASVVRVIFNSTRCPTIFYNDNGIGEKIEFKGQFYPIFIKGRRKPKNGKPNIIFLSDLYNHNVDNIPNLDKDPHAEITDSDSNPNPNCSSSTATSAPNIAGRNRIINNPTPPNTSASSPSPNHVTDKKHPPVTSITPTLEKNNPPTATSNPFSVLANLESDIEIHQWKFDEPPITVNTAFVTMNANSPNTHGNTESKSIPINVRTKKYHRGRNKHLPPSLITQKKNISLNLILKENQALADAHTQSTMLKEKEAILESSQKLHEITTSEPNSHTIWEALTTQPEAAHLLTISLQQQQPEKVQELILHMILLRIIFTNHQDTYQSFENIFSEEATFQLSNDQHINLSFIQVWIQNSIDINVLDVVEFYRIGSLFELLLATCMPLLYNSDYSLLRYSQDSICRLQCDNATILHHHTLHHLLSSELPYILLHTLGLKAYFPSLLDDITKLCTKFPRNTTHILTLTLNSIDRDNMFLELKPSIL